MAQKSERLRIGGHHVPPVDLCRLNTLTLRALLQVTKKMGQADARPLSLLQFDRFNPGDETSGVIAEE